MSLHITIPTTSWTTTINDSTTDSHYIFAPKLTGTRLWTSHRSSRTWDQSTVYANVPTSAAFSFTTFATAHDYTPQTTSTAPQAPELWTHFATNNPSSTAPSSTCPLPHQGLPAGPPQPVQSSLYAGLPQAAPPQFMASSTPATCTSQHPPPDTPPPTAKKSPPTKPPPSRRPLTRTSTSGFEDRLQRQFDSQMDQFQSKTQKMLDSIKKTFQQPVLPAQARMWTTT